MKQYESAKFSIDQVLNCTSVHDFFYVFTLTYGVFDCSSFSWKMPNIGPFDKTVRKMIGKH